MLERLAFVMLSVDDVDRAAAFYRDVLRIPMSGRFGDFAFFDTGEARLALTSELRGRDGAGYGHECVFGVASVTQAYVALKDSVVFLNEPRAVNDQAWAVNFRDPDGHLLSLYGPR